MRNSIIIAAAALLLLSERSILAGSATWARNPTSNDWNTALNWTPATVPDSATDVASFGTSKITQPVLTESIKLGSLNFASGADAFTITLMPTETLGTLLFFNQGGVINNSGKVQTFALAFGTGVVFYNTATAGQLINYNGGMGAVFLLYDSASAGTANFNLTYGPTGPGEISFNDTATAADATISAISSNVFFLGTATAANAVVTATGVGCDVDLADSSTADHGIFIGSSGATLAITNAATGDHGTFTVNGAQTSSDTPAIVFLTGTGGEATFTINGGAAANAEGASMLVDGTGVNTGTAIITINGGTNGGDGGALVFEGKTSGGPATVSVLGNGVIDLTAAQVGVTIGSLSGDGSVVLAPNPLTIGSNNLSTTFTGVIQGSNGITKTGTGTLTLSGANTYTGSTTVSAGTLVANTKRGSSTGTGSVNVNGGTLGGKGLISGPVTIGTGSGSGAILAPSVGSKQPLTLSLTSLLTLQGDSTYTCQLSTQKAKADEVIAQGVTIATGAQFSLQTVGNKRLATGTVFSLLSNTGATPINGTFANLVNGSTLTAGRNKLLVSYTGGDGNDLTLTVQ